MDALERGLVDELGGLRAAVCRAKVLAGLDPDAEVRVEGYPGASVRDYLRPRASTQPATASLSEAAAGLLAGMIAGGVERLERGPAGARVIWPGNGRF